LLTGDMDSIRPEVIAHYKGIGEIEVMKTPDQDHTDFTKAIQVLLKRKELSTERTVQSIVVFYTACGRLDHVLSIYNTLYKFDKDMDNSGVPAIILVDIASSISLLLTKVCSLSPRTSDLSNKWSNGLQFHTQGKHQIPSVRSAKWCSLVPLSGPVTLTTTGFRWNLHKDTLEFGKFISTSQEFDGHSEVATVDIADKPLLFSFDYE